MILVIFQIVFFVALFVHHALRILKMEENGVGLGGG